jgi:1-phosphatidylinositol-4-phosphate 5-kinase
MNIMDYSLMIGVHDIVRGNKDNVRDSTLQFFQVRIDFRVTHFHML